MDGSKTFEKNRAIVTDQAYDFLEAHTSVKVSDSRSFKEVRKCFFSVKRNNLADNNLKKAYTGLTIEYNKLKEEEVKAGKRIHNRKIPDDAFTE